MNECAEMLNTLGVAWVQAIGEAEFAAARLNAEGKVDAVITDDSDAFCYGAVRVLRNFTISGKIHNIKYYTKAGHLYLHIAKNKYTVCLISSFYHVRFKRNRRCCFS